MSIIDDFSPPCACTPVAVCFACRSERLGDAVIAAIHAAVAAAMPGQPLRVPASALAELEQAVCLLAEYRMEERSHANADA